MGMAGIPGVRREGTWPWLGGCAPHAGRPGPPAPKLGCGQLRTGPYCRRLAASRRPVACDERQAQLAYSVYAPNPLPFNFRQRRRHHPRPLRPSRVGARGPAPASATRRPGWLQAGNARPCGGIDIALSGDSRSTWGRGGASWTAGRGIRAPPPRPPLLRPSASPAGRMRTRRPPSHCPLPGRCPGSGRTGSLQSASWDGSAPRRAAGRIARRASCRAC